MKYPIIVEGPDASGKSSLATKLGEHYGMYTFRAGPKPLNSGHAELCMMYQTRWLQLTNCVWDRVTCISNRMNPPQLNRSELAMHEMWGRLASQHAIIVVCTAHNIDEHKTESYETGLDHQRAVEHHEQVYNNYIRYAHDTPGIITYDFKVRKFESLVEEIDHAILERVQRSIDKGDQKPSERINLS